MVRNGSDGNWSCGYRDAESAKALEAQMIFFLRGSLGGSLGG